MLPPNQARYYSTGLRNVLRSEETTLSTLINAQPKYIPIRHDLHRTRTAELGSQVARPSDSLVRACRLAPFTLASYGVFRRQLPVRLLYDAKLLVRFTAAIVDRKLTSRSRVDPLLYHLPVCSASATMSSSL